MVAGKASEKEILRVCVLVDEMDFGKVASKDGKLAAELVPGPVEWWERHSEV
jgi:predicted RNA-binding protein YlqC (UPF0109 family)